VTLVVLGKVRLTLVVLGKVRLSCIDTLNDSCTVFDCIYNTLCGLLFIEVRVAGALVLCILGTLTRTSLLQIDNIHE
jgi:hypothetical protein